MPYARLVAAVSAVALAVIVLAFPGLASAQDISDYLFQTGTPSFAAMDSFPGGISVNITNGNMHMEIPLAGYPQRGGVPAALKLVYDSRLWTGTGTGYYSYNPTTSVGHPETQFSPAFGWHFVGMPQTPLDLGGGSGKCWTSKCIWMGPDGASHLFVLPANATTIPGGSEWDAHALDGSGFHLFLIQPATGNCAKITTIYAKDGTLVYSDTPSCGFSNGSSFLCQSTIYEDCLFPTEDTNGNSVLWTYASYPPNPSFPWQLTADTLDRQSVISGTASSSGSGNLAQTNIQLNLMNSRSSNSQYQITTALLGTLVPFNTSNIVDPPNTGPGLILQSVALPDGSQYTFTYDCTPGNGGSPTACTNTQGYPHEGTSLTYGTMTSVTLPSGGVISFSYTTFTDANGNLNQWLSGINYNGGQWTYTPALGCGTNCQTVTVARPDGSNQVYTFNVASPSAPLNAQIQYYNGAVGGTPALTVAKSYAQYPVCTAARPATPMPPLSNVTVTVPSPAGNLTSQTSFVFDSIQESCTVTTGKLLSKSEYGFGINSPGPLLRTTTFSYLDDSNANYRTLGAVTGYNQQPNGGYLVPIVSAVNIADRLTDEQVKNAGGSLVAETKITYDSSSLTSVTGVQNHDDTNLGASNTVRGNPTLIQSLLNGSFITSATASYDTTGQITQIQDANNNATSLGYGDNYFTDATPATNPPAPYTPQKSTNAFLTKITPPLIGSATLGYYYGTGKPAVSIDQNGADYYSHYIDPMDRLTNTFLPNANGNRGWSLLTYAPGGTQADVYSAINDTSPSVSCSSCIHTRQNADTFGRPVQSTLVSDPDGPTIIATSYDNSGRLSAVTNPYRTTSDTTYGRTIPTYDGLGRTILLTEADGSIVHAYYGADVTAAGGLSTQYCAPATYGYGYPALDVDEAGNKTQSWSDAFGRLIEVDEPNPPSTAPSVQTCYTYDVLDNLTGVYQTGGLSDQTQWRVRTFTYDSLSRLTSSVDPESNTVSSTGATLATTYSYDANGNLLSETSPAQNQTGAATVTISYCYDALNRMTAKTYTYSPSTPPTCSGTPPTFPSPAATFVYDLSSIDGATLTNTAGRLVKSQQISNWNLPANTYFSYDLMGRVGIQGQCARVNCGTYGSSPNWWLIWNTYDKAGDLTSFTDAFGDVFTQTFDGAARPWQLTGNWVDSGHPQNLYTAGNSSQSNYSPAGGINIATSGNGLTAAYAYNNRLQPCRVDWNTSAQGLANCASSTPSSSILDFTYGFNTGTSDNGNVASWSSTSATFANGAQQSFTRSFLYDSLNRISQMTEKGGSAEGCKPSSSQTNPYTLSWSIDAWGNRSAQNASSGTCTASYTATVANRSVGGNWDSSGNLLCDGAHCYFYDAENRIYQVDGTQGDCSTATACYQYDAQGQRVAKYTNPGGVLTYFIYGSDGQVVSEADSNLNWYQTYIHFGGRLVAQYRDGGTGFLHSDHLGSTRLVTAYPWLSATQSVEDNFDYLPFGEQLSGASVTTHKFTGQERDDESGLDNFGARYDSSRWGRFMSSDPLSGYPGNPQSWNRYSYVQNNPLNLIDPTGMCSTPDKDSDDPDVDPGQCTGSGGSGSGGSYSFAAPNIAGGYLTSGPLFTGVLSNNAAFGPADPFQNDYYLAAGPGLDLGSVGNGTWNELWNQSRSSYLTIGLLGHDPVSFLIGYKMKEKSASNSTEKWAMRGTFIALLLMPGGQDADAAEAGGKIEQKVVTYLYQKLAANGEHLKFGVTINPAGRYTIAQRAGGRLKILTRGTAEEMLRLERNLHETLPLGPEERQWYYYLVQYLKGYKLPPY